MTVRHPAKRGDILELKTTDAEIAAGVTIVDKRYPPGNVLRYGTNTTPGTTDMSVAVQAAVNAMQSIGGTVVLPDESVRISQQIEITDPVTIMGGGWGSVVTCTAASTFIFFLVQDLVTATSLQGVVFRDFQIDANASGQLDAGIIQGNNAIVRCYNLRLKNGSRASGVAGVNGISFSKSSGTAPASGVIKDCVLSGFSKAPINVTSGTDEFLVEGNTCYSNTGNGSTAGIQINGGLGNVKVIGNTCYSNQGRGIIVTVVGTTPEQIPKNIIVSNNTCYSNGTGTSVGDGIYFGNAYSGSIGKEIHAVISGNICYSNGLTTSGTGNGILIENFQHVTVSGNRCYENGVSGCKVDTCDNVQIEGNVFYNNNNDVLSNASGLVIDACTEATILGNHFYDTQGTITQDWGVYFDAASSRITMEGNVIEPHDQGFIGGTLPTDSYIDQKGFALQTTGNTVTNIIALTMPDTTVATVQTRTIARETDGTNRAMYEDIGLFYREGGSATLQGAVANPIAAIESDAAWATTLNTTGNAFRLRVTGVAATTINWITDLRVRLAA